MRTILKALLLIAVFQSCEPGRSEKNQSSEKIKIVCTTSILTDWVLNIATEEAAVYSLLNKGIDPHVYKPSKKDLDLLRSADIIIYHGLHLEGKIIAVLEKMKGPLVIDVSKNFPKSAIITDPSFPASQDPHYWFDVALVKNALTTVTKEISVNYPGLEAEMKVNLQEYQGEIDSVTIEVQKTIDNIDPGQRIVITTHDALSYFARAFGLTVNTLQGASTVSEYGLRESPSSSWAPPHARKAFRRAAAASRPWPAAAGRHTPGGLNSPRAARVVIESQCLRWCPR